MKRLILSLAVSLSAPCCGGVSPASEPMPPYQEDDPGLVRKLVEANLKILSLELREARRSGRPEEELRVLLETGIRSEFDEVGAAAIRELSTLPEELRESAFPAMLDRSRNASETFRAQMAAFAARISSPEAEAALLQAAEDASPAVRIAVAAALKSSTAETAEWTLRRLLQDDSKDVRLAALDALGSLRQESVAPLLLDFLATQTDAELQEKAVDALGAIGSTAAVGPLLELLAQTSRDAIRWSCINSLGKIGDPRAAAPLRPWLEARHPSALRGVTIDALGKLKDPAAVPPLLEILREDPDAKLRMAAAAAIGRLAAPDSAAAILLPAYLQEQSEDVRRAVWAAMIEVAHDRFDALERLAAGLIQARRRTEAQEICMRLHDVKPEGDMRQRYLALEASVAEAAIAARDYKAALPHCLQLTAYEPERKDANRRVAECYRQLKDFEGALKVLRAVESKLAPNDASVWDIRIEIAATLGMAKDPEPLVQTACAMLSVNRPPCPEDGRQILEEALQTATIRLARSLPERDEPGRKAALDTLHRTAPRTLPILAAELEQGTPPFLPILEAGNAMAQTNFDPLTSDPAKLKEIAAAWRASLIPQGNGK